MTFSKIAIGLVVITTLMGCLSSHAYGQITFSDFGPGDSFDNTTGAQSEDSNFPCALFEAQVTGYITGFTVAVGNNFQSTPFTLSLFSSTRVNPVFTLGAPMGNWQAETVFAGGPPTVPVQVAVTGPELFAGTSYWLEVACDQGVTWYNNNQGVNVELSNSFGQDEGIGVAPAFSVQVQAVPEPLSTLVLSSCCLMLSRRKKFN